MREGAAFPCLRTNLYRCNNEGFVMHTDRTPFSPLPASASSLPRAAAAPLPGPRRGSSSRSAMPSGSKRLSPAAYRVLRQGATEYAFSSPLNRGAPGRHASPVPVARCPIQRGDEVRQRHRLAELLATPAQCGDHPCRQFAGDAPHRSAVSPLRRASRPCLRRRPPAHRQALLHERRGAGVHAEGIVTRDFRIHCARCPGSSPPRGAMKKRGRCGRGRQKRTGSRPSFRPRLRTQASI